MYSLCKHSLLYPTPLQHPPSLRTATQWDRSIHLGAPMWNTEMAPSWITYAGIYYDGADSWRPLERADFSGALGNCRVCLLVKPPLRTPVQYGAAPYNRSQGLLYAAGPVSCTTPGQESRYHMQAGAQVANSEVGEWVSSMAATDCTKTECCLNSTLKEYIF